MSQWGVQLVIGKLLTDAQFRQRFERFQRECLMSVRERGIDLDENEMTALEADVHVWSRLAIRVDRRLQRVADVSLPPRRSRPLTDREQRVLRGVFEGLTNKQIAAALQITEPAVKATLQHLFRKTRVRSRAQLVRAVVEGAFIGQGHR